MAVPAVALPRLYPILDAETLADAGIPLEQAAEALFEAGLRWLQYRDKQGTDPDVVSCMLRLRAIFPTGESVLMLNDRVHLLAASRADGVHVGQEDLALDEARRLAGADAVIGVSTHTEAQLRAAAATGAADYLAIGPVFVTSTKRNPDPVVGLAGVRAARSLTDLPLVAIGGITSANAAAVREAGADAVAVISGVLPAPGATIQQRVRDFLSRLR